MQKKYGITGVLGMSDQYDLDGYQLWGTWWSVPYYPSSINAALPAQTVQNKLDIVTFRWAARDPLNGYHNTLGHQPSLYSFQDYPSIHLPRTYYTKMLNVFAVQNKLNSFGQATVGLEGDLSKKAYTENLSPEMDILKGFVNSGALQVLTMKDFSAWYMKAFPDLSPNHFIQSGDLLGKQETQALWFQTPFYRVGITYDPTTETTRVVDLRTYPNNLFEPYYKAPNRQFNLSINLPYVIDTVIDPASGKSMRLGKLTGVEQDKVSFEKGDILLLPNKIVFPNTPAPVISKDFPLPPEGMIVNEYIRKVPFGLKRRFPAFVTPLLPSFIFPIPNRYYVSQTEYDALGVLKKLKNGLVLVYDKDCLDCAFSSAFKPAAMAGTKGYVSKYSGKPVIQDISFLLSKTSQEAGKALRDKGVTYVYLAKYEDYIESLPYLPEDLGVTKVYENANAEIWKVNRK